jgi:hypothetical protein
MSNKLLETVKEYKIAQKLAGLVRATLKHEKCRAGMQANWA